MRAPSYAERVDMCLVEAGFRGVSGGRSDAPPEPTWRACWIAKPTDGGVCLACYLTVDTGTRDEMDTAVQIAGWPT